MLRTIEGVFHDGKIELAEVPADMRDKTRVIVTFLETNLVNLRQHGIDKAHAAELRGRLATFAGEWDSPEMDIYDDYDAAKA
jgi:hypothetical protein